MPKNTGLRIMIQRKIKGITQESLAKDLGVHRVTISNWERGSEVLLRDIKKLAKYFNVPIIYFIDED